MVHRGFAHLDNNGIVVDAVDVPAGSYVIEAKISIFNEDPSDQFAHCTLSTGDLSVIYLSGEGSGGDTQVVTLMDFATFDSPASVTLTCFTFNGVAGTIGAGGGESTLMAIQVGALHQGV